MANRNRAMTLMEVLLVIVVMAILAGMMIPNAQPSVQEQLDATARILVADLAYVRSLAVTYGSSYRIAFRPAENLYVLEHTGTDSDLDRVPPGPFRGTSAGPGQYLVALDELPNLASPVQLRGAATVDDDGAVLAEVEDVEFGPLGETAGPESTRIWLSAGAGDNEQSVSIRIDPVSGQATVEPPETHPLPEALSSE